MSASSEKNNKPWASGREPTPHLHIAFHSTLNAQFKPTIGTKREWMFSRRQIASLIRMCWSLNEPSQSSSNPERQFTEVECGRHRVGHFGPGDHQIDDSPSTDAAL